jgi:energy-coupling factor transporter ATP-binding protein EcfA2
VEKVRVPFYSALLFRFAMVNRRERFRHYMSRLNAASHPQIAIKEDLYVKPPGRSVADRIVSRLELEPASSHLIVGGVGSGKTTQLLMIRKLLRGTEDVQVSFLEISERHDLSKLQAGVLIVLAGLKLGSIVKSNNEQAVKSARESFTKWAHGWFEEVEDFDDEPDEPSDDWGGEPRRVVRHSGLLVPPAPPLRWDIKEKSEQLLVLRQAASATSPHIVFLFDSLDRLTGIGPFAALIEQDLRAIRAAGIGVVTVGPLQTMYTTGRPLAEKFDHFYHQSAVDVEKNQSGQRFLTQVLRRRVEEDLLSTASVRRTVELSGGVLRDLISLARAAGEEAYTAGANQVRKNHVDKAGDAFGRTLLLGLDKDELSVLQRVRTAGQFVPTSDKDLALLITRRVLEYANGRSRYAVHPTLRPLLKQLE